MKTHFGEDFAKLGQGIGLGLYICKLIAGRINGTCETDSELRNGGKGSTFTLWVNALHMLPRPENADVDDTSF